MSWQGWVSLGLISGGTLLAVWTLVERRRLNPELFAAVERAFRRLGRVILRRRPRTKAPQVVDAVLSSDGVSTAKVESWVPESAAVKWQIRYLRDQVQRLGKELTDLTPTCGA